jgi:hypothetical protein
MQKVGDWPEFERSTVKRPSTAEMRDFCERFPPNTPTEIMCAAPKGSIIIGGATKAGKTTLVNAIFGSLPGVELLSDAARHNGIRAEGFEQNAGSFQESNIGFDEESVIAGWILLLNDGQPARQDSDEELVRSFPGIEVIIAVNRCKDPTNPKDSLIPGTRARFADVPVVCLEVDYNTSSPGLVELASEIGKVLDRGFKGHR